MARGRSGPNAGPFGSMARGRSDPNAGPFGSMTRGRSDPNAGPFGSMTRGRSDPKAGPFGSMARGRSSSSRRSAMLGVSAGTALAGGATARNSPVTSSVEVTEIAGSLSGAARSRSSIRAVPT